MNWNDVPGFFDSDHLYKLVVKVLSSGSTFVEVGSWMGRSTSCLGQLVKKSKKDISIYAVDTFEGSEEHKELLKTTNSSLLESFKTYTSLCGVDDIITPIKGTSLDVASTFEDESLDFVFIDASHDYENVLADISAWYPKVKPGGIISGDDYAECWYGVRKAVNQFFKNKIVFFLNGNLEYEYSHRVWHWCHVKSNKEKKMNVTLYAICKNEEKNVERFIENSKKFSHTVVVDTGSTDKTVQLLRDAGITVHEHPQTREEFDFSVARNQALSYVETEWAFSLDFNEDIDDYIPDGFSLVASEFTSFKHQRYDTVTEVSQVLNKQIRSLHTEKLTPESEKIKLESEEKTVLSDTAHIRFHRTKNYTWINSVHETPLFVPTEEYPEEINVETTIKITKRIFNTVDKELFYLSICERENKKDPSNPYYIWFIFKHYYEVKNYNKALEFGMEYLSVSKPYVDPTRINVFIMCSEILILFKDIKSAANYSFHALSESMKLGGDFMNVAFERLIQIGKITQNPNITIFATGFNPQTLSLPERTDAIDKLFLTNLDDIPSTSWGGHRRFAEWIVRQMNPNVTVDLGVDYGFSTFSFAIPRIGHVYGIDNFVGDEFVGYDQNRMKYDFVMMKREKLHLQNNLTFIEGDFDTVAKTWDKKIDILHIDGSHVYEDVKKDFETWTKFLSEDSVVLLHDTNIEEANGHEYGVKKFFEELNMPKFNFLHSFGLGVVSKNPDIIKLIGETFSN